MPASIIEPPAAQLRDRAAAEAYVASVCFKHGPPRRLGVELEWIVQHSGNPHRPLAREHLADALGEYAPTTISPDSPHTALPAGSLLTVEPGGQVEISTPPRDSLPELLATAAADAATVSDLLTGAGLCLLHRGADPHRAPHRIVRTPRYDAMHRAYQREGPWGQRMMCGTAAVQVSVDAGTTEQVGLRWHALYALGPVLLAAFANSPAIAGRHTGWASSRMAAWSGIGRAAVPPVDAADPAGRYARFALDIPLMCVRRETGDWTDPGGASFADWLGGALPGRPTTADLDFHLTTLFPPVRPQGHLEVRYLDAQPAGRWPLPVALLAALLADDETTAAAAELAAPTARRWSQAARCGLADPALAAVAVPLFELACRRLPPLAPPDWVQQELELVTDRQIRRGRSAAEREGSLV